MEGRPTRVPVRSFRDLEVYQRAQAAMREVHRLVVEFPEHERFGLTDQMRRASKSVGALIAEGWGLRQSPKEFKNYLRRALGSANEMEAHLDTTRELEYGTQALVNTLMEEYGAIGGQLVRLGESWRAYPSPSSTLHPPSSRRNEPGST
ncbi:MAG TPA: four helix bundle protein [Dehalococcoidia bacterium]|nr:four helix bundle protein [Dehalococcoidia bacterium]